MSNVETKCRMLIERYEKHIIHLNNLNASLSKLASERKKSTNKENYILYRDIISRYSNIDDIENSEGKSCQRI